MTSDHLPARWVLLASAGLACLLTGLAAWWFPEWTGAHLFVPVLLGIGLPPVVALTAGMGLWWSSESVRVRLDQARAWAQELANQARELEITAVTAIVATDDDAPDEADTADLPKLERLREQEVAHWRVFFRRIVAAGCAYGWGRDTLTRGATRVLAQPGWNIGTDQLQAAGYLYKDGAGTRLLVSEADWNAARLWERVPCPAGEPPEILPPPYNSATTRQNNSQTAAGAVVEGTVSGRD